MILKTDNMSLRCVRDVIHNETNDVYICTDENHPSELYYTLLIIKKHDVTREILNMFEREETGKSILLKSFSWQDMFCMLFDYKPERFISQFYMGTAYSLHICETICINLIMECISSNIPYPFLYLILSQNQIHLEKDNSIYFGYQLNLAEFDSTKKERDCAVKCAAIVKNLLEKQESVNAVSYNLLSRKIPKNGYEKFTELYKDVRLAAVPAKKKGIFFKIKSFFKRNQDRLFRIFLAICLVLVFMVIIMVVSQLVLGDIPFLRILVNSFKEIGTESMLQ